MKEYEPDMEKNLMTQKTYDRLRARLNDLENEDRKAGQAMGDAFGPDSDWHDNPAADFAVEEYKRIGALKADIEEKLKSSEIIKPRRDTSEIGIGNTVVVRLGDSNEDETFTILGSEDSGTEDSWISFRTPVGVALLGMKKGETKEFALGSSMQTVTVKNIRKGQF